VLIYAVDVKLAGSLSQLMSLPTMLVGFFRYSLLQLRPRAILTVLLGSRLVPWAAAAVVKLGVSLPVLPKGVDGGQRGADEGRVDGSVRPLPFMPAAGTPLRTRSM
jgi:hypothetical protein